MLTKLSALTVNKQALYMFIELKDLKQLRNSLITWHTIYLSIFANV